MTGLNSLRLQRIVDRTLAPWHWTTGPGVAIGVVQADALVVHRAAGLASIELGVPIGPQQPSASPRSASSSPAPPSCCWRRRAGCDSTASARPASLPELPDFGTPVTIAHLMHNTSGIRDMLEIMRQGGVDLGHPIARRTCWRGVCRQRGAEFPARQPLPRTATPASCCSACIVERISGESAAGLPRPPHLRPARHDHDPHDAERASEPVPGLATGYLPRQGRGPAGAARCTTSRWAAKAGWCSSVEDLALWHAQFGLPRRHGEALATALTTTPPFVSGAPNSYACGLRLQCWRGVRIVGHDGLWPGFKTSFVRLPDQRAAVICISNDATADPHDLAFQLVDALIEGAPGVHQVPPLPDWAGAATLAGCYLARETGATVDVARDAQDRVTASINGVASFLLPTADGRLATSRGSGDFTLRCADAAIEVERDAGIVETLHRVAPGATLPADLPGRYANPDTAATWTITATASGADLHVAGPLLRTGQPWEIAPIEGDVMRIYTPLTLYRGWLDTRVLRDLQGRITGLHVDGGRAKGLVFSRIE